MNRKRAISALIWFIFTVFPAAAQSEDTLWPMFHHDLNHTGLSTHYGPDTPAVKWIFPTEDKIHGSPVIGDDGTVYIGTHGRHSTITGSKLFAIYPNGTGKWQWNPGHFIDSTPAIAHDGTLYVGCWDKNLYAVHPNGTVKWEFSDPGGSFVYTSPAIAPDGTIYTGNNNNRLYAINSDGTLKWSYKTNGAIHSSPAVDADGTVYIGSNDKKLYAINPDGTLKWKYQTGSWVKSSPAIGTDGTIYVGSYDEKLHAINPADGTSKWKYSAGGRIKSSPAIGADGTIYVGSNDEKLHAINPDGTQKWNYTTYSYIKSSPAIDADGTIYVGSFDRNLYAINPDGSLLWKYNTGDRIDYSSPAIASDGTIYIGNLNGYVYAFGPGIQVNTLPVLDLIGNMTLNETETVMIDLDATDMDGDALYFSCNRTDLFTDFDPVTGTGNWTKTYDDAGIYRIDFGVSDGNGGTANETIIIEVLNINRPPVLDQIGNISVNENSLLEFTITAIDLDGDALIFTASGLPAGAVFDATSRTFSWTPGFEQVGTYPDIQFEVSDGELTDQENITIVVNNTNRAPVLDPVGGRMANENSLLEFTINGTDPDGDILTYSASNLPDGAVFNPATRTFSWTPTFEQAGTYPDVHFEVNDGELTGWEDITIVVNNTNRAPVLDQVGDKIADENSLLEFTINATDPDGDLMVYFASNLPTGAVFNPDTRTFSWTPTFEQAGIHPDVLFEVSDADQTDHENINIVVNTTNRPPVLDPVSDEITGENSLLEFTISAIDTDGDTLIFSASGLPAGAVFDPTARTFSWTPTFEQAGTYPDVHFEVNDGELTDWESITITVNNINRPPVLDHIGNRSVIENSLLEFTITAADPDLDPLSYSALNLPDGAVFDQHTKTFSWAPTFEQAGTFTNVLFKVSDGELVDGENITIVVDNTNRPPVLAQIGNKTTSENSLLEFTISATDPDGNVLMYSASGLPAGAVFDPYTRSFSWTPTFEQAGTYADVHFEVSDGESVDGENITIVMNNTNCPPVLGQIGNKTINENSLLEFIITATDPDGDVLTYSVSGLPAGAVFNPTTQTFSWTPGFEQTGTYPGIHFEVGDGKLTDCENITIIVADVIAPRISVIPPDSEVMLHQQFTVNITVDPMMNEIYGIQYTLSFDNSVLHAEWQNEGTFLNHDGAETNVYINTINNGAGTISFAATRVDVTTGMTDPGTLSVIKFTAIQKGVCSDLTLDGVLVADGNGDEIDPVIVLNSSICVGENQPPLAAVKSMHRYNNEGGRYLCKVYFDGAGSSDPDGEIIYWGWGFGDGNYGTGELTDHIYSSWKWNGTGYDPFTAILTVTDDGDPHQLDDSTTFDVIVYTTGDANGDGKVNILDATVVGLEWGATTTCGAQCWEGQERADRADLNNDCRVNILDAVIIGACWGHTAW